MKTMQPTLKNGRNVWDAINMPVCEFKERVERVLRGMKTRGLDVLLVYGYDFDECGNVAYLSNFLVDLTRGDLVVVTKQGDVTLFFEGSPRGLPSAKITTWVEDVRPCPDIAKVVAPYLAEKGLLSAKVGLAGPSRLMPHMQLDILKQSLKGCRMIEAEDLILGLRSIKTPRECDAIRRSARILRQVFEVLPDLHLHRMNEKSLEALIIREARMEGVEDVRVLFGKFPEGTIRMTPSDHQALTPYHPLAVLVSLAYERYWAEAAQTFLVKESGLCRIEPGPATDFFRTISECLIPGQSVRACYNAAAARVKAAGASIPAMEGLGAGIGLGPQENPILSPDETAAVAPGMAFSLRAVIQGGGRLPLLVGHTVLMTDACPEILTA